ncbi:ANTAR domain-containing protein [Nocardia takedensis]|uniref:ANTAR domain-containing protein n=1 Tax=Nocardia takedensis TaxID=259390 RepID=UPI00031EA4B8|nr:ANTAR domain-containing protein [Nocardia takedensis]
MEEEPPALDEAAAAALHRVIAAREAIEQAKGAVMLAYGLDATQAFALLRAASQDSNVKVRHLAAEVVTALPTLGAAQPLETIRARLDRLLSGSSAP